MAVTITLFTSTFDITKKSVDVLHSNGRLQKVPVGQDYTIESDQSGLYCLIINSSGVLIVKELWTAVTIAGATTPAQKQDKLVSFFGEAPAGGGGGTQNVYLYKSPEIDFYGIGNPQVLPLFTTETGKGRFILSRVSLEMTDIGGGLGSASFTIDTMPNLLFTTTNTLISTIVIANYSTGGFSIDMIPDNTLTSVSIDPNTLLVPVKGIFRIEGYYENDYV